MRVTLYSIIAIILASFIIGIIMYSSMPEKMASHWNAQGKVDGYISRFWGVFLMPFLSVGIFGLFLVIPFIDPKKKNIEQFRAYFDGFILLTMLFLLYLYVLTLLWNKGTTFNMVQAILPAFAILFFYCGVLLTHAQQNWSIGIRTPWTLSSAFVWDKTHKLGGLLFKIVAVIALGGIFFSRYAIFFILIPVILAAITLFLYSYLVFRKKEK
jgi:uncharacterized membrane protein